MIRYTFIETPCASVLRSECEVVRRKRPMFSHRATELRTQKSKGPKQSCVGIRFDQAKSVKVRCVVCGLLKITETYELSENYGIRPALGLRQDTPVSNECSQDNRHITTDLYVCHRCATIGGGTREHLSTVPSVECDILTLTLWALQGKIEAKSRWCPRLGGAVPPLVCATFMLLRLPYQQVKGIDISLTSAADAITNTQFKIGTQI